MPVTKREVDALEALVETTARWAYLDNGAIGALYVSEPMFKAIEEACRSPWSLGWPMATVLHVATPFQMVPVVVDVGLSPHAYRFTPKAP